MNHAAVFYKLQASAEKKINFDSVIVRLPKVYVF